MRRIRAGSRIAIVNVGARSVDVSEYIAGEFEYIMVGRGYTMIDRGELDRIRSEQPFQMSGEMDDNQAVPIGKIAGADVIISGAVTGTGELRPPSAGAEHGVGPGAGRHVRGVLRLAAWWNGGE